MKFNIKDYDGHYVMHCRTEEDAKFFLSHLDGLGLRWSSGVSYIKEHRYSKYEEETCYRFCVGEYCDTTYFIKNGYTILEFDDFDWFNSDSEECVLGQELCISFDDITENIEACV